MYNRDYMILKISIKAGYTTSLEVSVKWSRKENAWHFRSGLGDGFLYDLPKSATTEQLVGRLTRAYADIS